MSEPPLKKLQMSDFLDLFGYYIRGVPRHPLLHALQPLGSHPQMNLYLVYYEFVILAISTVPVILDSWRKVAGKIWPRVDLKWKTGEVRETIAPIGTFRVRH
jgi:hypothetical protein